MSENNDLPENEGTNIGHLMGKICPIKLRPGVDGRRMAYIDVDTGEVVDWTLETTNYKPKPTDFVKLYMAVSANVAMDETYVAETRILFHILSKVQFGNFVSMSRAEVADDLGLNRKTVARVMKRLLDTSIVQEERFRGMLGFRLNPNMMFCGNEARQRLARAQWNAKLAERLEKRRERDKAAVDAFEGSKQ